MLSYPVKNTIGTFKPAWRLRRDESALLRER
jgi:hypothetical protein